MVRSSQSSREFSEIGKLIAYKNAVFVPPVIAACLYMAFVRSFSKSSRRKRERHSEKSFLASISKFGSGISKVNKSSNQDKEESQALVRSSHSNNPGTNRKNRVGVNKRFFEQMKKLLPILVPGT